MQTLEICEFWKCGKGQGQQKTKVNFDRVKNNGFQLLFDQKRKSPYWNPSKSAKSGINLDDL